MKKKKKKKKKTIFVYVYICSIHIARSEFLFVCFFSLKQF